MLVYLLLVACAVDADQDGVLAELDCDDEDPALGDIGADFDCDGYLTGEDCDDTNPDVNLGMAEVYGDGIDNDCDGVVDLSEPSCISSVTITTPSGAVHDLDLCADWSWQPSFDFSDLAPPTTMTHVVLRLATDEGCKLELATAMCGEGYYVPAEFQFNVQSCPGLDEQENLHQTPWLRVTSFTVPDSALNLTGEAVSASLSGRFGVVQDGWSVDGTFAVGSTQTGVAQSLGPCEVSPGDEDGDGQLALRHGGEDCDDGEPKAFVGAAEIEDPDACMLDVDQDGWGAEDASDPIVPGTDCKDDDLTVFPGSAVEEGDLCTIDQDGDGWGDAGASEPLDAGQDCNDSNDWEYPGATLDAGSVACMRDTDRDGWGDVLATGLYDGGLDCNDADPDEYPGAVSEAGTLECMRDGDDDGFGDHDAPSPYHKGTDCNDADASEFPGAVAEAVNGECMVDADGDGFGDVDAVAPYDAGTDCRDDIGHIYPGAAYNEPTLCTHDDDGDGYGPECDNPSTSGIDIGTDCNDDDGTEYPGAVAEASSTQCMQDDDGDGFGNHDVTVTIANGTCYDAGTDCYDKANDATAASTYPGAAVDDSTTDCLTDVDGDGFGDDEPVLSDITAGTDCDDSDSAIYPGALTWDVSDGVDDDCDGYDNRNYMDDEEYGSRHEPATTSNARAGSFLAVGDVDADGVGDVYVHGATGTSWILNGPNSGWATNLESAATATFDVGDKGAGDLGDVNGDGYADLVHGAWDSSSRLVVGWYGPMTGSLTAASADFDISIGTAECPSRNTSYWFAERLAVGDLDGDSSEEVFVYSAACLDYSNWLFQGPVSAGTDTDDALFAVDQFIAYHAEVVEDLDGDGTDELVVAGYANGSSAGYAYVLDDATTFSESDYEDGYDARFGSTARAHGLGDYNGDGYGDLAVGRGGDGAFVYLGSGSGVSSSYVYEMDKYASSTYLGTAPIEGGDVDGDGNADLVVSGYTGYEPGWGTSVAPVYVTYGPTTGWERDEDVDVVLVWDVYDAVGGTNWYNGLVLFDLDGDGDDDVITGHPNSSTSSDVHGGVWVTSDP